MIKIDYDKCTGCGACSSICPKKAIVLEKKYFGFLYPDINRDLCIGCNLCDDACPANDIVENKVLTTYIAKNKDIDTRLKSSSGGIFKLLSDYVLNDGGVVFGAIFDEKFNVIITHTETDVTKMMGSKYVCADTRDSFSKCKTFLNDGRMVLYTGTPCQIAGLKKYLRKTYDNLITMDVLCHGVPSPEAWSQYLNGFNKQIKSVEFRNKEVSWEKYRIKIEFEDGTIINEYHKENSYMKLFLDNKILKKSCFNCNIRNNSVADITIGDAWGINAIDKNFNDHIGTSFVVIRTDKGANIYNKLNCESKQIKNSVIKPMSWEIPSDRKSYMKLIDSPKYAIVTIPGHQNIGNTLQAFALQSIIKELQPNSSSCVVCQKDTTNLLSFYKKNVNYSETGIDNSYSGIIVGSDQIWIPWVWPGISFDDQFLIHKSLRNIVYAASFGHHNRKFNDIQINKIHNALKDEKYISVRECDSVEYANKMFNINNVNSVLDPTMLFDADFYIKSTGNEYERKNNGIFMYVLDLNETWTRRVFMLTKTKKQHVLPYDGSVENFIKNMNQCKFVLTDSYHGAVFSLIFNKPFICLRNIKRGNVRFDDLSNRFDISNRFVADLNLFDECLLDIQPDIINLIHEQRAQSIGFLRSALYHFK